MGELLERLVRFCLEMFPELLVLWVETTGLVTVARWAFVVFIALGCLAGSF